MCVATINFFLLVCPKGKQLCSMNGVQRCLKNCSCFIVLTKRDQKWIRKKDRDEDLINNTCDNCIDVRNTDQEDYDKDGVGDACDNCPYRYNPDQRDRDNDKKGNACDTKHDSNAELQELSEEDDSIIGIFERLMELFYNEK